MHIGKILHAQKLQTAELRYKTIVVYLYFYCIFFISAGSYAFSIQTTIGPLPLDKYTQMVILEMSGLPARGLVLVWFAPFGAVESPVAKEYHKAVKQPKERGKIDSLLDSLCRFGFATHGIRFEKVKGAKMGIYELKITAQGSEHRFLAGYAQARSREGLPVLVLLRYVKKKRWKLDRTDIDTAVSRLAVAG